jgi:hypothetical protein
MQEIYTIKEYTEHEKIIRIKTHKFIEMLRHWVVDDPFRSSKG